MIPISEIVSSLYVSFFLNLKINQLKIFFSTKLSPEKIYNEILLADPKGARIEETKLTKEDMILREKSANLFLLYQRFLGRYEGVLNDFLVSYATQKTPEYKFYGIWSDYFHI